IEKQILEDSKSYLQQRIKKTVLHRGRNHGLVNIRVEPFFSFCFEKFFLQRAERIESWRILHRKNKQLGKKSTHHSGFLYQFRRNSRRMEENCCFHSL